MSYPVANEARDILLRKGYRIQDFRCIPGERGSQGESWQIVLTGPNGDEFSLLVGGPGCGAQVLRQAALETPTCGEHLATFHQ